MLCNLFPVTWDHGYPETPTTILTSSSVPWEKRRPLWYRERNCLYQTPQFMSIFLGLCTGSSSYNKFHPFVSTSFLKYSPQCTDGSWRNRLPKTSLCWGSIPLIPVICWLLHLYMPSPFSVFSHFSLSRALTCIVINTTKFWILIRNPFDVNRSFSVLRWNLQFYPRQFRSTMPHLIQIISCSTLCAYFGRPHKMVYHLPKLLYHCGFTFSGLG